MRLKILIVVKKKKKSCTTSNSNEEENEDNLIGKKVVRSLYEKLKRANELNKILNINWMNVL